ncbi:MAG: site-specific integrase [Sphingorhabdus sp.]|uniref:tyrosine-type recombinase/integrase n=1 Tax=Sphingorhabdus sp. TaxID=1902408 RepID=UPI0025D6A7B4|nr:site-specific integrase [Sphingorhabdus sp.]MCO4093017.1 site-specific integrase [Sphingorhabdus sp.]
MTLSEGQHLGYYRGRRVRKWVVRFRKRGGSCSYQEATIAEADDLVDSDGSKILSFEQAQETARKWFDDMGQKGCPNSKPYLVSDALDDYLASFGGKDLENTRRRIEAIICPQIGAHDTAKLTAKIIQEWHIALANAPARLRTAPGAVQNYRPTSNTADARRSRRSSANRILTILKAALNVAYRNEKIFDDNAWRRVKPFAKADAPRLRSLADAESRRLVSACNPHFRPMVTAALLTGARYSELAALEVRDFDAQSKSLWLRDTKSGTPRAVYLESEGFRLVSEAIIGKSRIEPIFPRPDGKRWGAAHQMRPMFAACKAAGLEHVSFHDLRRTYGARLARKGVPMAVIAEALGHADERITRKHYAHLAPSNVAETIREAVSGLGIV